MLARRVAVVGLGNMGSAYAGTLLTAGHDVAAHDPAHTHAAELRRRGGRWHDELAAAVVDCEVVLTALPDERALNATVSTLLETLTAGTIVVETSTLAPEVKVAAAARLGAEGVELLDCPVSGTSAQARDRDLLVFASGPAHALDEAADLLDAIAARVRRVGAVGDGMRCKLVTNLLVALHNQAAAEAMVLAGRVGLDPVALLDLLLDGVGSSRILELRGGAMAQGERPLEGSPLRLYEKDLGLITGLAGTVGAWLPLTERATEIYRAAVADGLGAHDAVAAASWLAGRADG